MTVFLISRQLMKVKVTQSCPALWDPTGYSLPGSSVHGVLQARILEVLPFPSPGVLPNPGIKPRSPALQMDSLPSEPPGKLMRHPLTEHFYLSSLLQTPNGCRMVDVEFLGNCSCSCKRISFDDPLNWSLSTSNGWPLRSSSSRLSSPLQNFLDLHCTVHLLAVPGPNVLLMLRVVSITLWPILSLNKKITPIAFWLTLFP